MTGPVGGSGQLDVFETDLDCNGTLYGPYNRDSIASWSASDSSIATVSGGSCTLLAPGTCTVTAQFLGTGYSQPGGSGCQPITVPASANCSVTAVDVKFKNSDGTALPSPLRVGISATTIAGQDHDRTQHLLASVIPAQEANNINIVATGSGANPGIVDINITSRDATNGVVLFDLSGQAKSGNRSDVTLKAKDSGSEVGTPASLTVVIPFQIATPHNTGGSGLVSKNLNADATTSPASLHTGPGEVELFTIYVRFLIIQVQDQFGDAMGNVYKGAEVSEFALGAWHTINQPLSPVGTYNDPVGETLSAGVVAASSQAANDWPGSSLLPMVALGPPVTQVDVRVQVDGFELQPSPAITNRSYTATPLLNTLTVSWP